MMKPNLLGVDLILTVFKSELVHCLIERFHSIPRDIKDKEKGGHVGVPNNR